MQIVQCKFSKKIVNRYKVINNLNNVRKINQLIDYIFIQYKQKLNYQLGKILVLCEDIQLLTNILEDINIDVNNFVLLSICDHNTINKYIELDNTKYLLICGENMKNTFNHILSNTDPIHKINNKLFIHNNINIIYTFDPTYTINYPIFLPLLTQSIMSIFELYSS